MMGGKKLSLLKNPTKVIPLVEVEGYARQRDKLTPRQQVIREGAIWAFYLGDYGDLFYLAKKTAELTPERQDYFDRLTWHAKRSLLTELRYNFMTLSGYKECGRRCVVDDVIPLLDRVSWRDLIDEIEKELNNDNSSLC